MEAEQAPSSLPVLSSHSSSEPEPVEVGLLWKDFGPGGSWGRCLLSLADRASGGLLPGTSRLGRNPSGSLISSPGKVPEGLKNFSDYRNP